MELGVIWTKLNKRISWAEFLVGLGPKFCKFKTVAYPSSMSDLRSYSSSEYSYNPHPRTDLYEVRIKKVSSKSKAKNNTGAISASSSSSKGWNFLDPEMQRKKRVAGYKTYAVGSKMKGYLRKSFRWIGNTFATD